MYTRAPGKGEADPSHVFGTWHAVYSARYENLPPDWTFTCTQHNRSVSTVAASFFYPFPIYLLHVVQKKKCRAWVPLCYQPCAEDR